MAEVGVIGEIAYLPPDRLVDGRVSKSLEEQKRRLNYALCTQYVKLV